MTDRREIDAGAVRFHIGEGYAIYTGPAGDNAPHAHAAFQIAIAPQGVVMLDAALRPHRGTVLVVPPLVRHRLVPLARLRCFYVEPHCAYADELRRRCGPGITALPELRGLTEEAVRSQGVRPSAQLDSRLLRIMAALSAPDAALSLPQAARQAGLSAPRLRALAREQLGMPLARWRIWSRLKLASDALGRDHSLADAAQAAGFADQAHFSRRLRQMFGVTPSMVLPLLRVQGRLAT